MRNSRTTSSNRGLSPCAPPFKVRAIAFDLDGTIVHSAPDLAAATNRMLEDLNMVPYRDEVIFEWIGNGARKLVARALSGDMQGEPEPELLELGYDLFFRYYQDGVCERTVPYPHVAAVLSKLQGDGFRLACVTNKPETFTLPLLGKVGLSPYFEQIVSGDSLPRKKPDPMPLHYICRQLDVPRESIVMVGDSISDIHAAQAASMPMICVSYGYNQGLDLTKARPDAIIDSFAELLDLIEYQH